jgi:hypothetical protein
VHTIPLSMGSRLVRTEREAHALYLEHVKACCLCFWESSARCALGLLLHNCWRWLGEV